MAPSGLYARLCHAFLVSSFFYYKQSYLSIYWTDFHAFHQMEGICVYFLDPVQFLRFLKGRCHGNQLCVVPDLFARSRSISGSAGPIFAIFSPYESALHVDGGSVLHIPIFLGTLPCKQIILRKCYQRRLISLAFVALVLENELQYHKNLVNFCLVTPEIMGLICVRLV